MRTKYAMDLEGAVDECVAATDKLVDELIGMVGERDRKILELESRLRDAEELAEAYKIGYYKEKKK